MSGPFPHRHLGPSLSSAGDPLGGLPCPRGRVAASPPGALFLLGYSCFTCWFLLSTEVSQLRVYTHPLPLGLPPTPAPSLPSRASQSAELSSLCDTAPSHELSALHLVVYRCHCHPLHSPVSTCPFSTSMPLFLPCT